MSKTGLGLRGALRCVAALMTVAMLGAVSLAATTTAGVCAGDCDADGRVEVAELIRGVGIALGVVTVDACPQYDCAPPGCVVIQVLTSAVEHALHGCPPTPSPTPTGEPPTVTPIAATSTAALERVIAGQCTWSCPGLFRRAVWPSQQGYGVECDCVSGHSSRADFIRPASSVDATAAFRDATSGRTSIAFPDLPAAYWVVPNDNISDGGADRYLIWQLGCWLITAHSFDDTHFQIAAPPVPFSEAILADAGERLLAECDSGG